jgi:hypothetical protein
MALRRIDTFAGVPDKHRSRFVEELNAEKKKETVWLKHEMVLRRSCRGRRMMSGQMILTASRNGWARFLQDDQNVLPLDQGAAGESGG